MVKNRRQYGDDVKTRAVEGIVKKLKAGKKVVVSVEAEKLGIASTVLRHWLKKPKFGGGPDLFKRKVLSSLPTNSSRPSQRRAKPLVPMSFVCPHCGGPVTQVKP